MTYEDRITKLKEEIESKKHELVILQAEQNSSIIFHKLDELTDSEKIVKFDTMFIAAKELIDEAIDDNHWNDNHDNQCVNLLIENTIVKDDRLFWNYFNTEINC